MSKFTDKFEKLNSLRYLICRTPRGCGKTNSLINVVKNNYKAVLIVHSQHRADDLVKEYGLNKNKVISITNIKNFRDFGDVWPILDHEVLDELLMDYSGVYEKLRQLKINMNIMNNALSD